MNIGLIGLGKMGLLHASILSFMPDIHLAAVCEGNGKVVRFAKNMFGQTLFVDSLGKLAGQKLDAVYITTPIPSHFAIAQFLYSENITANIFVEKTLTSNYEESVKLINLAKQSNGVNMVGYMNRFAVTFKKCKELLDQRTIGKIVAFEAHALSSDFIAIKKGTPPRGGVLNDLGSHVLDLAIWYFGELQVKSVKTNTVNDSYFDVKTRDEVEGIFDVSWQRKNFRNPEISLNIKGSLGNIEVNNSCVILQKNNENRLIWYRQDLADNVPFLLGAPEYYREDEHFVKSLEEHHFAEPDFETASKVDQIISEVKQRIF